VKTLTRLQVGLFGLVFHVAAAALLAAKAAAAPGADWRAIPGPAAAAAVAAFVVYAVIVTPYARKRFGSGKRGVVLFDFLVGMLAEIAVVALASLFFAIFSASGGMAGGIGAYLQQIASTAVLAFLWVVGTTMTEVLALGNAAGFAGWFVLKKLAERAGRAAERGGGRPAPGVDTRRRG
jgi:hypothetical protein